MNKNINIPGRLHSVATDGQVAGANEIYDDEQQKFQGEINAELHEEMEDTKEVVDSFDDRVKAIEDLAEISIEGGEVQVANTAEEIVAGSGKVPTANALNERLTSSDYVDGEPSAGSEKLVKSGGVYNEVGQLRQNMVLNSGYLSVDGKVTDIGNTRYSHSPFLLAIPGMIIDKVKPASDTPHQCLYFYDEFCKLIGTYNAQSGTSFVLTLTSEMIPSGAKYVRFNIYNEDFKSVKNYYSNGGDGLPNSLIRFSLGTIVFNNVVIDYVNGGIKFTSFDAMYFTTNDGISQPLYVAPGTIVTFESWDYIVYSLSTQEIQVKKNAQRNPGDIVLAVTDGNSDILKSSLIYNYIRKAKGSTVVYNSQIEQNVDVISFQPGSITVVFNDKTNFTHYIGSELVLALSGTKFIVLDLSTNTITEITSSSNIGESKIVLLVIVDGHIVSGALQTCVVNNPLRLKYGYINWEDGEILDNDKRIYSRKMKFDHDVYVGFRHPIINTQNGNTLQYRVYLYGTDGTYSGLYVDPSCYYPNKSSYTIANIRIPKDYIFAVVLKYSNEDITPDYDREYIVKHSVFDVSNTPLYYQLPSYYTNGENVDGKCVQYISSKIEHIDSLIQDCSVNGDVFINIADVHFERNQQHSPALIKYITDRVRIERLFNVGDDFDGNGLDVYRIYANAIKDGDYYWVVGNHDAPEYGSSTVYPLQTYNALASTHFPTDNKRHYGNYEYGYYYTDNVAKKIRYIILNSIGDSTKNIKPFDDEQMQWFENVALNVESGWTIIIFTHIFLVRTGEPTNYEYAVYGYARDNVIPILNRYNGNGIIAAIFAGDDHADRVAYVSDKNIPVILTMTDGNARLDAAEKLRVTISEQAFDVVVLDKTQRKITMVRIGAKAWNGVGLNNRGTQVEYREITY